MLDQAKTKGGRAAHLRCGWIFRPCFGVPDGLAVFPPSSCPSTPSLSAGSSPTALPRPCGGEASNGAVLDTHSVSFASSNAFVFRGRHAAQPDCEAVIKASRQPRHLPAFQSASLAFERTHCSASSVALANSKSLLAAATRMTTTKHSSRVSSAHNVS